MRILFWTELFWPSIGGIEVRCRNLGKELVRRGHVVSVVTSHGSEELPDEDSVDGITIHRFRFLEALSSRRLDLYATERRRLSLMKKKFHSDIVHVMFTDPSVLFHWQTDKASPAPTVVSIPIGLEAQQSGPDTLLHRTLRDSAWIVAVSEAMLHDVRKLVPDILDRSSVIYNSIDEPSVSPLPLPFDPPRFICVGRLVHDKGFDTAIDAFSAVRARFPGIKLVIAGDGPARAALAAQADTLGLDDSIEFTGWIQPEDIAALINTTTVMIVPSRRREAFGNVVVQAMQMGRPVVVANVGGLPEIVIDGTTGYLVPTEDPVALADAIERLLTQPEIARQMGVAGRARASTEFPFGKHVDEHEKLYRTIIDGYQFQS